MVDMADDNMVIADFMGELTNMFLGMEQIWAEAQYRWLRPTEICEIFRYYESFGLIPTLESPDKPPGGSLFLFNECTIPDPLDGHSWIKERDGETVREAHEKLKAGSIDVLHCYYTHGEDNENFQRRCYSMLDKTFSNELRDLDHIVLVHYREVKEGTRPTISRGGLNTGISSDSFLDSGPSSSMRTNSPATAVPLSFTSSPSIVDWNGPTPSSELKEMKYRRNSKTALGNCVDTCVLELRPACRTFQNEPSDGPENSFYSSQTVNGRQSRRAGNMVDRGWEYGTPVDASRKQVICKFCDKIISGGIFRFKQHIGGIKGNVAACTKATEEAQENMKELLKVGEKAKKAKEKIRNEIGAYILDESDEDVQIVDKTIHGAKRKVDESQKGMQKLLALENLTKSKQMKITTESDKKAKELLHKSIGRFFYHCAIPFHVVDSPYFHKMIDIAGMYKGQGVKLPGRASLAENY